jgi:hypothetical protein
MLPDELAQKFDHRLVYFLGAFLLRPVPAAGQYDLAAKLWNKEFCWLVQRSIRHPPSHAEKRWDKRRFLSPVVLVE